MSSNNVCLCVHMCILPREKNGEGERYDIIIIWYNAHTHGQILHNSNGIIGFSSLW